MKTFSALTWNIWFGEVEQALRLDHIAGVIRRRQPDFVALQELTPTTFEALTSADGFADLYNWSPNLDRVVAHYGSGLFCRHVASWDIIPLPSGMGRHLITATVGDLTVGTVHLESLNQEARRREQLALCFSALANSPSGLLMGDMNFDLPETHPIPPGYLDVWPHLHPNLDKHPGYTRDTQTNFMAKAFRQETKRKRIDRIFFRPHNSSTKPIYMDRLGLDPINDREEQQIYASDHYGLYAAFGQNSKNSPPFD